MAMQLFSGLLCALIFVTIQQGDALQCWVCSSDLDIRCMDPFNASHFYQSNSRFNNYNQPQYQQRPDHPRLDTCSQSLSHIYGQKPMCLKRVITDPSGRQRVSRECVSVSSQQYAGRCPTNTVGRGFSVDFCEYCEYDGCNSATSNTINLLLTSTIPCLLLYFYRA